MSRDRPYREGLLFDTNTLFQDADRATFPSLCRHIIEKYHVRCCIPAPSLAELLRNSSARIHDHLLKNGVLKNTLPAIDPRDEIAKLAPAEILPLDLDDVFALIKWTENVYGSQSEFGRYKARLLFHKAKKLFSHSLFNNEISPFHASRMTQIDRDRIWMQIIDQSTRTMDTERLSTKMSMPTTADWLIIGTALRHNLTVVTNEAEKDNEFRELRREVRRVLSLKTLKKEVGFL